MVYVSGHKIHQILPLLSLVHTYNNKNMLFELALPFSSVQDTGVFENSKNLSDFQTLPVRQKCTISNGDILILEKQQKTKHSA